MKVFYENAIGQFKLNIDIPLKEQLVTRLLVRWKYILNWPDNIQVIKCPKNYISIEGYPGVYIGIRDEALGDIMDTRDKTNIPSFNNMIKRSTSELYNLLIVAIEKQKEELIANEGKDAPTLGLLESELIEFKKNFNIEKAENEYKKIKKQVKTE